MHLNPRNMNGAKCYICGQPDHLANACPSKGKIKAGAQSSLKTNKSFMALWQRSFADHDQQKCASRILKSWGDDVCPTCLTELSFDHRCDVNDIAIAKHTDTVRDVFRTTPLLDTIQSAHAFERASTEKPAPISMGPNFFLNAGGHSDDEDESANNESESQRSQQSDQSVSDDQSESDQSDGSTGSPQYESESEREDQSE